MKDNKPSLLRSILLGLAVVAAIIIFAYGFDVAKINFAETREPQRQTSLIRVLRALARPDIIEYDRQDVTVNVPIYVPCPAGDVTAPPTELVEVPDTGEPYLVLTPPCADPRDEITIEGFNFEPNSTGNVNFIPPSAVTLKLGGFRTNTEGYFSITGRLPNRPNEVAQMVNTITRHNVGAPRFSRNAYETWDKIVETVFIAFIATVIGTIISIILSFFAAQNLMKTITSPIASTALSIILFPIGAVVGATAATWLSQISNMLMANIVMGVGSVVIAPLGVWGLTRWALPPAETTTPSLGTRIMRTIALLASSLLGILFLFVLSSLLLQFGANLQRSLGDLGFLGGFLADLGDILGMVITITTAFVFGAFLVSLAGNIGQLIVERVPKAAVKVINLILSAVAGALLFALIGAGIDWLYELGNPVATLYWPAAIGGVLGVLVAAIQPYNGSLPIGYVIYYVTRTILNALRSMEPLIMVIVFVVWVGIGPFAGTLALGLHTIAALAKLYSEQVENIASGPLEAITATGANRLQTIVYAVIPQIIPPYISFTMYRWDINVRMSTILGFAGGGGIGFLLLQNINLLNYRAASTQMLAIAIVVASMDYLSAKLREKVI